MNYVIKGYGAMRNVNRNLHRPSVMPDDEASAPEGGIPHGHWRENQGRPILPEPKPIKVPRSRRGIWLVLFVPLAVVAVAGIVGVFFL